MKVVIITNYWKDSPGGGYKTYVMNLVNELEKRDISIKIIFREGVDASNFKGYQNKVFFCLYSFYHLLLLRPDVIHSFEGWHCILPSIIYKKIFGCRVIYTFMSEPLYPLPKIQKQIYEKIVNYCDLVHLGNHTYYNKILNVYKIKITNFVVITSGLPDKQISENAVNEFNKKFGINSDDIVILVQGFTAEQKKMEGVKLVLESTKKLSQKFPKIKLLITREGFYSEELKFFSKIHDVTNFVIFTGDLQDDEPYTALKRSNIFVHPYVGEMAIGIALLEAMVMGKPIIMTSTGGNPEIIEDKINGLIIEPTINNITDSIEYLIENEKVGSALGINAKKTIERKFCMEKFVDSILAIYSK